MASVEDLDELLATRKINGLDDGLYKEDLKTLKEELEQKNKEFDNYLATHKDYLSDEAEVIRKDIHRLINKIALLEKSATKKEENVVNMTEEAFNEIIDNFEVVAYLTVYGRRGIKENVKRLQKENGDLREKVKELDAKNDEILKDLYSANCIISDLSDSIPKQKIKDLKESIKIEPVIVGGRRNRKTLEYGIKLGKIKACEELLEDE